MAVYTHVDDDALSSFLQSYDLGEVQAFKGIAGGVENSNYLLQTTDGSFILTLYEKRVAEEDLPFFIGLMDHLSARDFPCPLPVRGTDGSALRKLCGRPAALVTFLPGMDLSHPEPRHCHEAGAAMARLHLAAEDFDIHRTNALAPAGWPPLAEASAERADEVEEGLRALIAEQLTSLAETWPTELPQGVIHADFFRDNVFFLGDALSGVIDFYFACNDILAYDLAIALNAWCFDDDLSFMTDRAAAFVDGYRSVRPLSAVELDALPVLARGAALRFLLTRLHDWLNVPPGALVVPHDPKAFSARLRFHASIDSYREYGIA